MRTPVFMSTALLVAFHWHALAQSAPTPETRNPPPQYQMTIVSRTTKAINYGYLSAPTRIDFKGTPAVAAARGEAIVEPKRGSTLLKMRFDHLPAPSRFGAQFLTYVVWAISPDGRAQNIGELILDGSEKGRLSTSTPLQTFAMIVTAEPYYSVTQPGDVVVMENVVGRDTIGKIEEVNATYELLPRKPFTYDIGSQPKVAGKPVSQEQYEAITALYQALNAIQIAQSQEADRYAPDQLTRARQLYEQARNFPASLSKEIVSMAREAAQIAEDSRTIAVKRAQAEKTAMEQQRLSRAQQAVLTAQAAEAEAFAEGERARRMEDPQPSFEQSSRVPQPPPGNLATTEDRTPVAVDHSQFLRDDPRASENRRRLLSSLPATLDVIDSSRGVLITIPEQAATAASLRSYSSAIAAAIRPYRDLHIEVGGHTDIANAVTETEREAERVRLALIAGGVSPGIVAARGYGNTRPRASNASVAGRLQNRRIEIVIAGDAIGTLATTDRTYRLEPPHARR